MSVTREEGVSFVKEVAPIGINLAITLTAQRTDKQSTAQQLDRGEALSYSQAGGDRGQVEVPRQSSALPKVPIKPKCIPRQ